MLQDVGKSGMINFLKAKPSRTVAEKKILDQLQHCFKMQNTSASVGSTNLQASIYSDNCTNSFDDLLENEQFKKKNVLKVVNKKI